MFGRAKQYVKKFYLKWKLYFKKYISFTKMSRVKRDNYYTFFIHYICLRLIFIAYIYYSSHGWICDLLGWVLISFAFNEFSKFRIFFREAFRGLVALPIIYYTLAKFFYHTSLYLYYNWDKVRAAPDKVLAVQNLVFEFAEKEKDADRGAKHFYLRKARETWGYYLAVYLLFELFILIKACFKLYLRYKYVQIHGDDFIEL